MNKKVISIISLVLMLSLLVIGCSSNEKGNVSNSNTKSNSGEKSTEGKKKETPAQTETVQFFYDHPPLSEYLQELNPLIKNTDNVEFDGVLFTESVAFQTAVRVGFTTQEPADTFKWWSGFRMKELADAGYLADMTDVWQEMIADGVMKSMADPLTVDGKIYGIPAGVHYWTMFYNKKLFNEHGLKAPTTWDEFILVSDTLKAKGVTPIGTTTNESWMGFIWFEDLMLRSNPDFYDKLMIGKAKYTDPEVVEVMKLWKSMYDKGYFSPHMTMDDEIPRALIKGDIGMYLVGTWWDHTMKSAGLKPDEDYGVFILPSVKPDAGRVIISEVTPFLVSNNSPNKEAAIKAMVALTKKDANEKLLSQYGGLPIRNDIEPADMALKSLLSEMNQKNYNVHTRFWEATPSELSEYASSEFVRFMLNPDDNTITKVLDSIQKKADQYWAEHK